jgi:hypothetical protein
MFQAIPLTRKNSLEALPPSTNGGFVTCEYYINVECHFAGSFFNTASDKEFTVKLIIVQPGIKQEGVELPMDWHSVIQDPLDIFLDFSSTNDLMSSMCRFGANS